jgi:hypothetical protein
MIADKIKHITVESKYMVVSIDLALENNKGAT